MQGFFDTFINIWYIFGVPDTGTEEWNAQVYSCFADDGHAVPRGVRAGGGSAGGNSIDIEQQQVNATVTSILEQKAKLEQAFTAANDAVTSALAAFDEGDSNKATLKKVLTKMK